MLKLAFKDGEAQFSKGVFAQAMENGEAIVCDELNGVKYITTIHAVCVG